MTETEALGKFRSNPFLMALLRAIDHAPNEEIKQATYALALAGYRATEENDNATQ